MHSQIIRPELYSDRMYRLNCGVDTASGPILNVYSSETNLEHHITTGQRDTAQCRNTIKNIDEVLPALYGRQQALLPQP